MHVEIHRLSKIHWRSFDPVNLFELIRNLRTIFRVIDYIIKY
jgi:hypothetical protein